MTRNLVLALAMLVFPIQAFAITLQPLPPSSIPKPHIVSGVWTINLAGHSFNGRSLEERIPYFAQSLLAAISSTSVDWDFIVTQEAGESVACDAQDGKIMPATSCLAETLRGSRNVAYYTGSDNGIIVNADRYDVLAWHDHGLAKRQDGTSLGLAAVRVKSKYGMMNDPNYRPTFLVASIHTITAAAEFCKRDDEFVLARDLINEWMDPADIAPIVAGDFNCTEDSAWGTDVGENWCNGHGDAMSAYARAVWQWDIKGHENDLKLCREYATFLDNIGGDYHHDIDMILAGRDRALFAPYIGKGTAGCNIANAHGESEPCTDHLGWTYSSFVVGSALPQILVSLFM